MYTNFDARNSFVSSNKMNRKIRNKIYFIRKKKVTSRSIKFIIQMNELYSESDHD